MIEMTTKTVTVAGIKVQHDKSGVGHNWVAATADNCPANIQEEIAGEILDGDRTTVGSYTATNGCKYRWGKKTVTVRMVNTFHN